MQTETKKKEGRKHPLKKSAWMRFTSAGQMKNRAHHFTASDSTFHLQRVIMNWKMVGLI